MCVCVWVGGWVVEGVYAHACMCVYVSTLIYKVYIKEEG